jgi:hypothetical protein
MSIKKNFLDASVGFYLAHKAWKAAPDGPLKVATKQARGQALSELITAGDLHVPKHEKPPSPP